MATKKLINILFLTILFSNTLLAKDWNFEAILNDRVIGQHTFKLETSESTSKADFHIEFMFMDIYYNHLSREIWNGDCLIKIDSQTNDDGDSYNVKGQLENNKFKINVNEKVSELPSCNMTFAYWNHKILKQTKLINSQDGELLDIKVKFVKDELIPIRNDKLMTKRYELKAIKKGEEKLLINLWYDKDMNWVALSSKTPIGDIFYKLL